MRRWGDYYLASPEVKAQRIEDCDECREVWDDDPPCNTCLKPTGLESENVVVWETWRICDFAGRDGRGKMKASEIVRVLDNKNGAEGDLDKVLTLEAIHRTNNKPKKKKEKDGQADE